MKEQSISIKKTFDNFIVNRSNKKAYSACVDFVKNPKGKFLTIYGANSYGKSNLLYAIKNALVESKPDQTIRFINYDDVISKYIDLLRRREHQIFIDELLTTDILIMDNMQFIGGKESTQEEIADWINRMIEFGKSAAIAFDRPVKYYTALLKGVRERNPKSSVVVEIKRPDCLLRRKYLNHLLNEYPVILPLFVRECLIYSRRLPFSSMTGFLHKCSLLEKKKGKTLSVSEIRRCLSSYTHKEAFMIVATVEYVADYIEKINQALGLSMKFKYIIEDKGKYPLRRKADDIVLVPDFFNHEDLTDSQRKMMIALFYSVLYLGRTRKVHPVDPEHLAKGICDVLGEEYIPFHKIEERLRSIRISLYDEPEYASFFSVGDEVRVSCCSRYRVIDVKKEKGNVYITAEPIGYKAKFSTEPRTFEEAELFEMYTHHEDYSGFSVDLRKNLIIFSAPSATGKNTIYNALKSRMSEIERAITATTRKPRINEIDSVDYYFYSKDHFNEKKGNGAFVEYNEYDNNYYATPYSEIDRYSSSTPLFLIVDTHGMMSIMRKYPLSMSVFLAPPSIEELEKRIRERGDNTPGEIKRRIEEAIREMQHSDWYDYVVKNIRVEDCVDEFEGILRKRMSENGIL